MNHQKHIFRQWAALAAVLVLLCSCGSVVASALVGGAVGGLSTAMSASRPGTAAQKTAAKAHRDHSSQALPAPGVAVPVAAGLSAADSLRYRYYFLEAVRQQNAGHFSAAYDLFRQCLRLNPQAAEAWFYRSMYEGEIGNDSLSVACLERAAALNPANDTYQEHLAQHFLAAREHEKARLVYERLADANRQRIDVLKILAQLYQLNHDYDGMLRALSRMEDIEGTREEITLSKMRVYELKGDSKAAWQALRSLAADHPNDVNYRVMMGNWLMQHNRSKEAYKIFTASLREEPDNAYTQSSLYDYYRATSQDSLAKRVLRDIVLSPKASAESKSVMMRQAIQENEQAQADSTEILRLFDEILITNPNDSDMAEMKVAYMNLKHMPEDSVAVALRQLLAIMPENVGARTQLLGTRLHRQDWPVVAQLCHEGTLYNPDEMVFYYYEGLAYYQQDLRDEALATFQRGVSQINASSNAEIVADFYYFMGDILHQKDRVAEAFAAYDSCLQWKPDHMGTLNNYAYYLSLNKTDLPRAEQMSFKTIKEEPTNPTYLDTYAWILFLEERYAEAKIYIDQALAQQKPAPDSLAAAPIGVPAEGSAEARGETFGGDGKKDKIADETDDFEALLLGEATSDSLPSDSLPSDTAEADTAEVSAVIIEHAGDIYALCGQTDRAVEFWQEALLLTTDRADILEQKIRKRQYIADEPNP